LSSCNNPQQAPHQQQQQQSLPRVVWKQAIVDVEAANNGMTGESTKLQIPKPRLRHHGPTTIRSDWSDVHVYAFDPWVRQLIQKRTTNMVSIQQDLIPLLVARQFQGRLATFGKQQQQQQQGQFPNEDGIDDSNNKDSSNNNEDGGERGGKGASFQEDADPSYYSVVALVIPNEAKTAVLRVHTTASYLYANREVVARMGTVSLPLPADAKWNGKFQTLVLMGGGEGDEGGVEVGVVTSGGGGGGSTTSTQLGKKLTMQSTVIGRYCDIGAKCRLNNVVAMDHVTIGENCSLQNTILGAGATVGANCSLNDCQVGPMVIIPAGTKEKGEAFLAESESSSNKESMDATTTIAALISSEESDDENHP
jgi:translation initiation factor eIF-2B subunit gamma